MALLPPGYLDAVAALEVANDSGFSTVATGVIIGFASGEVDSDGQPLYAPLLVTNRHVLEGENRLYARFSKGTGPDRFELPVMSDDDEPLWKGHEKFDVAVLPVNLQPAREAGNQHSFVAEGEHTFSLGDMEDKGVSVGDGVFVLGFPMGLSGAEKKRTIVRSGGIARLDAEVIEEVGGFLIDATIFPGNSGGPVFNVPSPITIQGTKAVSSCCLIGIVQSYLPYEDVAVSKQTGRERIVFQENSGLASVVPFDAIKETAGQVLAMPQIPGAGEELSESDAQGEETDPPLDAAIKGR